LPLTPGETGGIATNAYKDFWNKVQTIDDYDWNSGQDTEDQRSNCPTCKVNYPDPEDSEGEEEEEEEEDSGSDDGEYDPNDMTDFEEDYGTDEYWSYTLRNIEENLAAISGAIIRLAEGIKEFLSR
jgi:cobalamin biosynthesis protein CobT